jgi:hypothetical protein
MHFKIRPANSVKDWESIRRLCCLTGNGGEPISKERWPFFAEQWIGPYQRLPSLSYVSVKEDHINGYLVAVQNTVEFEKLKFLKFSIPLAAKIFLKRYVSNSDTRRFLKRNFYLEKGPEQSFPLRFLKNLKNEYPAHLHMNVENEARGLKIGAQLIERLKEDLRQSGVHGVHLFCGDQPIPFYQKQGFSVLHRIEFKPEVFVYALGARF